MSVIFFFDVLQANVSSIVHQIRRLIKVEIANSFVFLKEKKKTRTVECSPKTQFRVLARKRPFEIQRFNVLVKNNFKGMFQAVKGTYSPSGTRAESYGILLFMLNFKLKKKKKKAFSGYLGACVCPNICWQRYRDGLRWFAVFYHGRSYHVVYSLDFR